MAKQTTPTVDGWQNRIVGEGEVAAVELVPHPQNWRKHPASQGTVLAQTLDGVGWVQRVIVNRRTGRMLDGHLRAELARKQGEQTPVPVVYVDLSEDEERTVLATLDPIAGMAIADEATLAGLVRSIEDADLRSVAGTIAQTLNVDVDGKSEAGKDTEPQVDRAEELRQKWGVEPGQLWQLGEHRLICGDCTDAAVVARVMAGDVAEVIVTDPPYGIGALGGRRQTHEAKRIALIENDDLDGDALVGFLAAAIAGVPVSDSASFYVCYGWKSQAEFTQALKQCGLTLRATITWVKNVFGLSAKNNVGYRPQTEFLYFATKSPEYIWKWHGGGTQSDVWQIDRPVERVGNHPTNKPVELPVKCIENSSDNGDVIYEPFSGSGTTIIACENLGRRCRAVEIAPGYVAVALERWAVHTGKTPVLLDE